MDPREWWEEVYLSRVGTNGVVIGRQDPATVTRIKDEFDRLVARYAVDAGQVALLAVAVLGSGQRTALDSLSHAVQRAGHGRRGHGTR